MSILCIGLCSFISAIGLGPSLLAIRAELVSVVARCELLRIICEARGATGVVARLLLLLLLVDHRLAAACRADHVAAERVHDVVHVRDVVFVVLKVVHLYLPYVCTRHIVEIILGLVNVFLAWVCYNLRNTKHLGLIKAARRLAQEVVRHGLVELVVAVRAVLHVQPVALDPVVLPIESDCVPRRRILTQHAAVLARKLLLREEVIARHVS